MKEWRHNHFQGLKVAKAEIMDRILSIATLKATSTLSNEDRELHLRLQEEFRRKFIQEEVKWKQRYRARLIAEGDHITKYFHAIAGAQSQINRIHSIEAREHL